MDGFLTLTLQSKYVSWIARRELLCYYVGDLFKSFAHCMYGDVATEPGNIGELEKR